MARISGWQNAASIPSLHSARKPASRGLVLAADALRAFNVFVFNTPAANEKGPAHSPGLDQFGCGGRI
ncbi:hypothetical protein [Achromobacter sp. 2789STDY5608621]|uniref:hypothetical protein n=1 Tax=Achromobacter sp. 2789STDY5608621 TaxID=1806496 RepID=UPI0012E29F18|nr:hypothetical protein [Achromobacter sp. 2789STDY5608621]